MTTGNPTLVQGPASEVADCKVKPVYTVGQEMRSWLPGQRWIESLGESEVPGGTCTTRAKPLVPRGNSNVGQVVVATTTPMMLQLGGNSVVLKRISYVSPTTPFHCSSVPCGGASGDKIETIGCALIIS